MSNRSERLDITGIIDESFATLDDDTAAICWRARSPAPTVDPWVKHVSKEAFPADYVRLVVIGRRSSRAFWKTPKPATNREIVVCSDGLLAHRFCAKQAYARY